MTTETELHTLPIDAHLIAIDESRHYSIPEADAPFIAQIRGIYLFDRNVHTYCCEMTPSHFLTHICDSVTLTPAGEELDEYAKDRIYQDYELNGGDDIYIHVRDIDRMIDKAGKGDHYAYGSPGVSYEDVDYDDQMESLREHFNGNMPL
jgi:hypothetical protein